MCRYRVLFREECVSCLPRHPLLVHDGHRSETYWCDTGLVVIRNGLLQIPEEDFWFEFYKRRYNE